MPDTHDHTHLPPPPPPPPPFVPVPAPSRVVGNPDGVYPHRRIRVGFGEPLLGVVVLIVSIAAVAAVWIISEAVADPDFVDRTANNPEGLVIPDGWLLALTFVSSGAFLGWPWIVSRWKGTRSVVRDFGLRLPTVRDVGLGVGLAVGSVTLSIVLTELVAPALGSGEVESNVDGLGIETMPLVTFLLFLFGSAVLTGFGEELFFRGLVFTAALNRFKPAVAIGVQAVLFGVAHFSGTGAVSAATVTFTLIIGAVYGYVVYRTGRLAIVAVAHLANNASSLALIYFWS